MALTQEERQIAEYGVKSGKSKEEISSAISRYRMSSVNNQQQEAKKETPILTNESGGIGTALRDVAVGAGKSIIGGAIGTASLLQSGGKKIMEAVGGDSSEYGFKSLDNNTKEGKGVQETLRAKSRGEQVGKVLGTVGEFATGFTGVKKAKDVINIGENLAMKKQAKNKDILTETLSPKPTIKEAKLAQTQGRLIAGKDPTLFRSGTADTIAPTEKIKDASRIIMERIPNAQKLKPTELYAKVNDEITKTAEALRPQMQSIPIKPETIQKINDDWTNLKSLQIKNTDATEEANILKLQNQFEERLMKSGNSSYDDLWQARIDYDNSVPANVKKANSFSSESLQNKKEIWLQNREILNGAIKDTTFGMGKTAQQPFDEMSSLYDAQTNLLSKAKVNKEKMSKINQVLADNPKIASALGGVTVYQILKNLGIPLP